LRLLSTADARNPQCKSGDKQGDVGAETILVGVENDRPLRRVAVYARSDLSERFAFLDCVIGAAGLRVRCERPHHAYEGKNHSDKQKLASEAITARDSPHHGIPPSSDKL